MLDAGVDGRRDSIVDVPVEVAPSNQDASIPLDVQTDRKIPQEDVGITDSAFSLTPDSSFVHKDSTDVFPDSGHLKLDTQLVAIDSGASDTKGNVPSESYWLDRTPSPLPASWPSAREQAAYAYDSERKKLILFGGYNPYVTPKIEHNDLWEWDSISGLWQNRTPTILPVVWPAGRATHKLVYDPVRKKVILFGGVVSSTAKADLWEWDGTLGTWTDITPFPLPDSWPSPTHGGALVFDSQRNRLVQFGGITKQVSNALWEWDLISRSWSNRTPTAIPPYWPNGRSSTSLAFDSRNSKTVLFGGDSFADLWEWDGQTGTWSNRTPYPLPTNWPSWRYGQGLVYDPSREKIILFGGADKTSSINDLWEWDVGTGIWNNLTNKDNSTSWPSPRHSHGLVYDTYRAKLLIIGGSSFSIGASRPILLQDLWEWTPSR
jgi:hypothetical protein